MSNTNKYVFLSRGSSMTWTATNQLKQFFSICDSGGTDSVDREAFHDLCNRLSISVRDADLIFEDLDEDRDGRISFADFSRGFTEFSLHSNYRELESDFDPDQEIKEDIKNQVWTTLTNEAERVGKKNSNESKLKLLLDELKVSEQRHLVPLLENAVEELLRNLQDLQKEKAQLEDTWLREKFEHERHLKKMEEELDNQVKDVETRMRMKAQAEVEDERKSLQLKMDAEMNNLQAHMVLFEKVNSWLQSHPTDTYDVKLHEIRSKLDEAVNENRQLRMSLLDTQTSIALVRSELFQLRSLYEEKCRELSSEREKVLDVLHEQDHLSHQLSLLHDVNKILQDTNDSLRDSLEVKYRSSKEDTCAVPYRNKSGSIVGDYVDLGLNSRSTYRLKNATNNESADEGDEDDEYDECDEGEQEKSPVRRRKSKDGNFQHHINHNVPQALNQSDSGVSTARDSQEVEDDLSMIAKTSTLDGVEVNIELHLPDKVSLECSNFQPLHSSSPIPDLQGTTAPKHSEENTNPTNTDAEVTRRNQTLKSEEYPKRRISDIIKELGIEENQVRNKNISLRGYSLDRQGKEEKQGLEDSNKTFAVAPIPLPRMSRKRDDTSSDNQQTQIVEFKRRSSMKHEVYDADNASQEVDKAFLCHATSDDDYDDGTAYEADGQGEETFKVVFIGDAGVGKSSFALRISKGVFIGQMSSTLGVDFLMRTLRVDGQNYSVQLWDTAGQERFRSITKSYFRKADGVLLLYDCICEQSFLNVRQWVEDVDSVTCKRIPLMIVANKIDLRPAAMASGQFYVTRIEGQRLAEDFEATFTEASAKNGSNVLHSLANLVRSMLNQKELHKSASTMHLCVDNKAKKSTGCCGK